MGQMMQAVESFYEGELYIGKDEVADADHEIVRNHPDMWRPVSGQFLVEQATAAPGEKRAAKATAKK